MQSCLRIAAVVIAVVTLIVSGAVGVEGQLSTPPSAPAEGERASGGQAYDTGVVGVDQVNTTDGNESEASSPTVTLAETYDGCDGDTANAVQQTADGGYVLAGTSERGGDRGQDAWLVRTDASGTEIWNRTFGGPFADTATAVVQTDDGGFVFVGQRGLEGNASDKSALWVVSVNASGGERWNVTFAPGQEAATAHDIVHVGERRYVVAGEERVAGNGTDAVVLEVAGSPSGASVEWSRQYGRERDESAQALTEAHDSGYVFAGRTREAGDVRGDSSAWLVRVTSDGEPEWQRRLRNGTATAVVRTSEGYALSGEGPIYGFDGERTPWLLEADEAGREQWSQQYPLTSCSGTDLAHSEASGYALVGSTCSDVLNPNVFDGWVLRTDGEGVEVWNTSLGADQYSAVRSVVETDSGTFALAGSTSEADTRNRDAWLLTVTGP